MCYYNELTISIMSSYISAIDKQVVNYIDSLGNPQTMSYTAALDYCKQNRIFHYSKDIYNYYSIDGSIASYSS